MNKISFGVIHFLLNVTMYFICLLVIRLYYMINYNIKRFFIVTMYMLSPKVYINEYFSLKWKICSKIIWSCCFVPPVHQ